MIKECKKHGLTEHSIYSKKISCKKCNVEAVTKQRRENKKKLVEHFGGCCNICGYNKCINALEFHHLDPKEKDFDASTGKSLSLKRQMEEAKKCILICCRCHTEIHENIGG